jgi:hypothetical protein
MALVLYRQHGIMEFWKSGIMLSLARTKKYRFEILSDKLKKP